MSQDDQDLQAIAELAALTPPDGLPVIVRQPNDTPTEPGHIGPYQQRVLQEAAARVDQHEAGGANQGAIVLEVAEPFLSPARLKKIYDAEKLAWCAAFACFCWFRAWADFRKFASVDVDSLWARLPHGWVWARHDAPEKRPAPADLIFFRYSDPNRTDLRHVGLVERMDDEHVHTIEGNAQNAVRRRKYLLSDPAIYGYARPVPSSDP